MTLNDYVYIHIIGIFTQWYAHIHIYICTCIRDSIWGRFDWDSNPYWHLLCLYIMIWFDSLITVSPLLNGLQHHGYKSWVRKVLPFPLVSLLESFDHLRLIHHLSSSVYHQSIISLSSSFIFPFSFYSRRFISRWSCTRLWGLGLVGVPQPMHQKGFAHFEKLILWQ